MERGTPTKPPEPRKRFPMTTGKLVHQTSLSRDLGALSPIRRVPVLSQEQPAGIRAIVRVRGPKPAEGQAADGKNDFRSWMEVVEEEADSSCTVHIDGSEELFGFDSVYDWDSSNAHVFTSEVEAALHGAFLGRNCTILAYGATASGKSHLMQGNEREFGLMTMAFHTLHKELDSHEDMQICVSYIEDYNDQLYDLLEEQPKQLQLRDDAYRNTHIIGLSEIEANTTGEFVELITIGTSRRHVASTLLNTVSSRSHGILILSLCRGLETVGKVCFVDLAGNEDNRKTGNRATRLEESCSINSSLFSLSKLLEDLTSGNFEQINFRGSKLTRILKDCFGGPSSCLMIACVNPYEKEQALFTLQVASKSKKIRKVAAAAGPLATEVKKKRETQEERLAKLAEFTEKKKASKPPGSLQKPPPLGHSARANQQLGRASNAAKKSAKSLVREPWGPSSNQKKAASVDPSSKENQPNGMVGEVMQEQQAEKGTVQRLEFLEHDFGDLNLQEEFFPAEDSMGQHADEQEASFATGVGPGNSPDGTPQSNARSNWNDDDFSFHATTPRGARADGKSFDLPATPSLDLPGGGIHDDLTHFLNTADKAKLQTIKNVGEAISQYIIDYREKTPFKTPAELMEVEYLSTHKSQVPGIISDAASKLAIEFCFSAKKH